MNKIRQFGHLIRKAVLPRPLDVAHDAVEAYFRNHIGIHDSGLLDPLHAHEQSAKFFVAQELKTTSFPSAGTGGHIRRWVRSLMPRYSELAQTYAAEHFHEMGESPTTIPRLIKVDELQRQAIGHQLEDDEYQLRHQDRKNANLMNRLKRLKVSPLQELLDDYEARAINAARAAALIREHLPAALKNQAIPEVLDRQYDSPKRRKAIRITDPLSKIRPERVAYDAFEKALNLQQNQSGLSRDIASASDVLEVLLNHRIAHLERMRERYASMLPALQARMLELHR